MTWSIEPIQKGPLVVEGIYIYRMMKSYPVICETTQLYADCYFSTIGIHWQILQKKHLHSEVLLLLVVVVVVVGPRSPTMPCYVEISIAELSFFKKFRRRVLFFKVPTLQFVNLNDFDKILCSKCSNCRISHESKCSNDSKETSKNH